MQDRLLNVSNVFEMRRVSCCIALKRLHTETEDIHDLNQ